MTCDGTLFFDTRNYRFADLKRHSAIAYKGTVDRQASGSTFTYELDSLKQKQSGGIWEKGYVQK